MRIRSVAIIAAAASIVCCPIVALANGRGLNVVPAQARVGQPITFFVGGPIPGAVGAVTLNFDDGSSAALNLNTLVPIPVTHAYARPGIFDAVLTDANGVFIDVAGAFIVADQPRVPTGQILSSVVIASPVLAGTDSAVVVNYRVDSPEFPSLATHDVTLQAIVDLENDKGELVRRSDPFVLFASFFGPGAVNSVTIPYTVPSDAAGAYRVRVFLRTNNGASVAVGPPEPLLVTGGPKLAPSGDSGFHANGVIEAGRFLGATAPFVGSGTSGAEFSANINTAYQWPARSLELGAIFDPVSHATDATGSLSSATPGPLAAPDAVAQPVATALRYRDAFGRTMVALPSLLGGGETLRGADLTYSENGWTYHSAAGMTSLGNRAISEQFGDLVDLSKTFSHGDTARLAFVQQYSTGEISLVPSPSDLRRSDALMLDVAHVLGTHLQSTLAVATSAAADRSQPATSPDASDKFGLAYTNARESVQVEYHNAGATFQVGGGPGALADRAGTSASASFGLTPISSIELQVNNNITRSGISRQSDTMISYTLSPPNGFGANLLLQRDRSVTQASNPDSREYSLMLSRPYSGATLVFGTTVATLSDPFVPTDASVTRTTIGQYQVRHGSRVFGIGINASRLNGATHSTSVVGESVTYGIGFRPLEVQFGATAINSRTRYFGNSDVDLTGLLSYRLTQQAALVLKFERALHSSSNAALNSGAGGIRLRLDLGI